MKRFLIGMLVLAIGGVLFAQASPFSWYGSARTGFFFVNETFAENPNPNYDGPDGKFMMFNDQFLQGNSRIGVDYQKDNLTGKVEIGAFTSDGQLDLRKLYGKYDFDGWSILAGKDADGTDMLSNQTFNNDLGLNGYGAIYGGRNPQIRFGFMEDALYLAIIKGSYIYQKVNVGVPFDIDGDGEADDASKYYFDTLIPKINLGYKWAINDDMTFHPTVMFQMFNMDADYYHPDYHDETIMSFLAAMTFDWKISDEMKLRVHGNFGQNTANMGFKNEPSVSYTMKPNPDFDSSETEDADNPSQVVDKIHNVSSMGGYLTFGYNISEQFGIGVGAGYAQTTVAEKKYYDKDNKEVDWSDNRMAFYLQLPYKTLGALTITPEFGMQMEMANSAEYDEGSLMYFGAQLKYDF